jgi:hypothetical protein
LGRRQELHLPINLTSPFAAQLLPPGEQLAISAERASDNALFSTRFRHSGMLYG